MDQGQDTRPAAPRGARVRAYAWGAAGVVTAALLIAGSVAGLNQQIVGGSGFERFADDPSDTAIVLPDHPHASGVDAHEAPGRRAAERRAASPSPVRGSRAPADPPVRAGAPAHDVTGGGASLAASGSAAGGGVRAELGEPSGAADGAQAGEAFAADGDTDRDGLTDRTELLLGTNARSDDTDGDELPDGWETRNQLDPRAGADAGTDADGDGLLNRTEYRVRSNPQARDTDGNGAPDGADDTDGDGQSDAEEAAGAAGAAAPVVAGPPAEGTAVEPAAAEPPATQAQP